MKAKEYEIRTLSDIADAVTVENLDNFMVDFKNGFEIYIRSIAMARILDPSLENKPNTTIIAFEKMVWIDDNKHEQTFTIKVDGNPIV